MMNHGNSPERLAPLRTIWRLQEVPTALPADFTAELRRRIRDGEYDSCHVVDEIARQLLRSRET